MGCPIADVGGGAGYSFKVLGRTPAADGWRGMHPHSPIWLQAAALVRDGVVFARRRLIEGAGGSGGYKAVADGGAADGDSAEKPPAKPKAAAPAVDEPAKLHGSSSSDDDGSDVVE